jgi:hypothetical protein
MLVLAHKLVVQKLTCAELAQNEDQSNGRHSINNRSHGHRRAVLSTHYGARSNCRGIIGQDGINAGACPQIGRPDAHLCGIGPERRPVEWPPFNQQQELQQELWPQASSPVPLFVWLNQLTIDMW